jgi:hypothetical protein
MRILLFVLSVFFVLSSAQADSQSKFCQEIADRLQPGDIVFLDIDYMLFKKVAEATLTWTSHVGIAFPSEDGEWLIAESTFPLSKTGPLCKYLARTTGDHVAIRRVPGGLSQKEIAALWQSSQDRMGILYHQGFDLKSKRQFCSKFVYEVFQEALGFEVGYIQTMREILDENPEGDQTFWKWWYLGSIPWERETVTPKAQLVDSRLLDVWSWESR